MCSAKVEEVDQRRGQYGDLRALRNLFQDTMSRLCFILANWHRVLFMWKKSQTLAKDQTVRQEELRRLISSRLRHQKEPHPWCYSWNFRTATNVLLKQGRCCRKLANTNMLVPKPSWKDGTRMTITESLSQTLGGLESKLSSMTRLHW